METDISRIAEAVEDIAISISWMNLWVFLILILKDCKCDHKDD